MTRVGCQWGEVIKRAAMHCAGRQCDNDNINYYYFIDWAELAYKKVDIA